MAENWQRLARTLDYPDEVEMWQDLYLRQGLSIPNLGQRLGYGNFTIRRRLLKAGIPLRGQGGNNHPTPPAKNVLFHLDQRVVWGSTIERLKELTGCSVAVISKYKKLVRGES